MNTISSMGTPCRESSTCPSTVLPATVTSGFGVLYVSGRRRLPRPASGMMICMLWTAPNHNDILALERPLPESLDDVAQAAALDELARHGQVASHRHRSFASEHVQQVAQH